MARTWTFYVEVQDEVPDETGKRRQVKAFEMLTGIGDSAMPGPEAQQIAERLLSTDERTRHSILDKYPGGATASLRAGYLSVERLWDPLD